MRQEFYSNGKLLITGEYAVLDGALALAVPTKYGQNLLVTTTNSQSLIWTSLDNTKAEWFKAVFSVEELDIIDSTDIKTAQTLQKILIEARKLNSSFLTDSKGIAVETQLTFPRNWGLGSSSTLINSIAQWAKIDAHQLLWKAFSGSGYDISCAQYNAPILYQLKDGLPKVTEVDFNPSFKDSLYFVFLNQKQNSRAAITNYRQQKFDSEQLISEVTEITRKMILATSLSEFETQMLQHEEILSKSLKTIPVKELLFPDYKGAIKSLGAWGGDFILATGNEKTPEYFISKGYSTVILYADMVL